tara:strand:+ start:2656 stop:2880 length:225 start_codon:yes stop_codon:yes gene_type:complete
MKKGYSGPYYVVDKKSKEIFTYKKDVGKYYNIYGTYKQMQEKLSKKGLILTREVDHDVDDWCHYSGMPSPQAYE